MSKAESREEIEYPVSNLEVLEGVISNTTQVLIDWVGQLADEGVSLEDLELLSRVSSVAERIIGPIEQLLTAINEAPYEATVLEGALETDDQEAGVAEDPATLTARPSPKETALESTPTKSPGALSEREQQIWKQITSNGSRTEWFGQKDLDMGSISFSSPSAKNQAFSQFCKKAIATGILIDNGKERGGRRYIIAPNAPTSLIGWDLSQVAKIEGQGPKTQDLGAAAPEDSGTSPIEPTQEASSENKEIYDLRFEVIIRGNPFSFTPLEYKIIKALLEGKEATKDIIAHINGHEGLEQANPDFYNNEFQPALKYLEGLLIGDTPLVKAHFLEGPGGKFIRFRLPDGARIESKRGVETLRFTDSSTLAGRLHSRPKGRRNSDTEEPKDKPIVDHVPPSSPRAGSQTIPKATKPGLPKVISGVKLSETGLIDAEGEEIALEPQRRAVLNALRSGTRLTVADIAKQINPGAGDDATFKSIVADELAGLQRILGGTRLRRKQKPGTQAKWWLEVSQSSAPQ